MAHFENSHRRSKQQFDNDSQNSDVIYRDSGKDSSNGQVIHEAFPVVPDNPLEISPIVLVLFIDIEIFIDSRYIC